MHDAALRFVRQEAARLPLEVRVFEIGCRNINGSARVAFPHASAYHGIDLEPGPDVDAVANGLDYDPPFVPDVVVCCEVLEHTPEAERLCQRAFTVLAQGGTFLATMAGPTRAPHSAADGGALLPGEFYRNCFGALVAQWCVAFTEVRIVTSSEADDVYLVATRRPSDVKEGS